MSNRLRAAVDDYLEEEREYVRDVEAEIARLAREAQVMRVRTQRAMIAALYWRAGEFWATGLVVERLAANTIARAARAMEAAL